MKQDSALAVKLLYLRTDLLRLISKIVNYDRTSKKIGRSGGDPRPNAAKNRDHSLGLLKKELLAAEKDL